MLSPEQEKGLATVVAGVLSVFVFTTAPVFRFVDPAELSATGAVLSAGLALMAAAWKQDGSRLWYLPGAAIAMYGALAMTGLTDRAHGASNANDRRCLAIQVDMLSARPRREDSANLFQALGCRPQGGGSVHARGR